MIAIDLHTHTYASHGQDTVLDMYRAGLDAGLTVLGFSEHSPRPLGYDYPCEYREHLIAEYPKYLEDVRALQCASCMSLQATPPTMQVLLGIELDWIDAELSFMQRVLQAVLYDYVIGGLHFLGTWGFDASPADWDGMDDVTYDQMCDSYYVAMRSMAQSGLVDIVAHPDLIKIFTQERFYTWLAKASSINKVGEALEAMATHGVSMEVSSAGLRKACASIYPCPTIMRLAKECGLRITFGSDSHCVEHVAYAFARLRSYAHEFGFTESVHYVARKPHISLF